MDFYYLAGSAIAAVLLIFYFLPAIISEVRHAEHSNAILAINLFLGWTVFGWFAALIWAIVEKPAELVPIPEGARTLLIRESKQKAKAEALHHRETNE